jgi:hypothetical protein
MITITDQQHPGFHTVRRTVSPMTAGCDSPYRRPFAALLLLEAIALGPSG